MVLGVTGFARLCHLCELANFASALDLLSCALRKIGYKANRRGLRPFNAQAQSYEEHS